MGKPGHYSRHSALQRCGRARVYVALEGGINRLRQGLKNCSRGNESVKSYDLEDRLSDKEDADESAK